MTLVNEKRQEKKRWSLGEFKLDQLKVLYILGKNQTEIEKKNSRRIID